MYTALAEPVVPTACTEPAESAESTQIVNPEDNYETNPYYDEGYYFEHDYDEFKH